MGTLGCGRQAGLGHPPAGTCPRKLGALWVMKGPEAWGPKGDSEGGKSVGLSHVQGAESTVLLRPGWQEQVGAGG